MFSGGGLPERRRGPRTWKSSRIPFRGQETPFIPGLQNVADAPSRGFDFDLERLQITWKHLVTAAQGGSRKLFDWGKKRHVHDEERTVYEEAPAEVLDELDAFDHRDDEDDDVV